LSDSAPVMSDPFSASLAGRRLGRYEVLARLASGGMAAVYVARALGVAGFERLFAVKVLHPHLAHEQEFITMFLDEARLAARIRHPNVVPTTDISDTQDAGYYLVMDYIEGDHLGALLQKAYKLGSRLPAPISLRVLVDTLEGLAAAHALTDESGRRINLVHRDVSPHNVMVSTDGIARITDFGVAKAEVRLSTTRQGQFKGKLAYMAPEHASTGDADQRSDLFSAAIILWECLTGRRLFRAENQAATLNKICIEPIPMPSSVDPALAAFDPVLERALARDPEQRFQTAEEFAEAIEERADALGGLANQRTVSKLVREYAADKIERDRELIRSAIAEISVTNGDSHGHALPTMPTAQHEPARQAQNAPMPPPIALPQPAADTMPEPPRRNWALWAIGLALLVAAGAALGHRFITPSKPVAVVPVPVPVPPPAPAQPEPVPTPPETEAAPAAATPEPAPKPRDEAAGTQEPEAVPPPAINKPAAESPRKPSAERHDPTPRPDRRPPPPPPVDNKPTERKKPKPPPAATNPDLLLNPYRSQN
jgi:eukaryotic-like serine/threonine-protein kinase